MKREFYSTIRVIISNNVLNTGKKHRNNKEDFKCRILWQNIYHFFLFISHKFPQKVCFERKSIQINCNWVCSSHWHNNLWTIFLANGCKIALIQYCTWGNKNGDIFLVRVSWAATIQLFHGVYYSMEILLKWFFDLTYQYCISW